MKNWSSTFVSWWDVISNWDRLTRGITILGITRKPGQAHISPWRRGLQIFRRGAVVFRSFAGVVWTPFPWYHCALKSEKLHKFYPNQLSCLPISNKEQQKWSHSQIKPFSGPNQQAHLELFDRHYFRGGKKYGTLHEFACHPCAGAMLIVSVSFQF